MFSCFLTLTKLFLFLSVNVDISFCDFDLFCFLGKEGRTPVDLLLGVSEVDVLELFTDREVKEGFEGDHQERLLRTFVKNNYEYHLQVSNSKKFTVLVFLV